jgi:ATP-dependent DNA helicase RecG
MFIGMPLLEVQMAVFATKQKLTFLDIRRGSGNIRQQIDIAVKYIIDNMRWRVVLDGSIQRKEIPEAPIEAIREAVTNSFCHRDYRSSQNNEVAIYSDRIEIYNPGRFPEGQTPEDFINGKSRSIKRNPNIAQLLYYSKDIESFGTGLQRIVNACAEANVRVEFERSDMGFTVIFYRPVNHINTDGSIGENIGDSIGDSETQKRIVALMKQNPKISAKAIATEIGIAPRNVEANIKTLKQAELIERVGSAKSGHWTVREVQENG